MPGPVTDPRAHALHAGYHNSSGARRYRCPWSRSLNLLGLAIHKKELDGISGLLYPEERQIHVNGSDVLARRRFTIAHELGHWVCQCLEGRGALMMCRGEDVSPDADRAFEREANVFAAEFLMPEPTVRARFIQDENVTSLAMSFGVSVEAMQWRLYNYGLRKERPVKTEGAKAQ